MTVYNGERHVGQTVESILGQTFTDFEFLITDDGSMDSTFLVLSTFAARDQRITLFRNEQNMNITRSMNGLFRLAKGEYISRHDADDISVSDRFVRQVEFLDTHTDVGLVASDVQVIDEHGQPMALEMFVSPCDNESIQQLLVDHNCLCQGSVMFRRPWLEAIGLYDETLNYTEDYDLWLRMSEVARVEKLPDKLYWYRRHSESVSFRHYGLQTLHSAIALEKAYERRTTARLPRPSLMWIADIYLRAAELCALAGEPEKTQQSLLGIWKFQPEFFETDKVTVPFEPTVAGLQMAESALGGLPKTPSLARWIAHFFGRWHLRQVFEAASKGDWQQVHHHLWVGLRHDPSWLLNWGVIVISLKALLWRVGEAINAVRRAG